MFIHLVRGRCSIVLNCIVLYYCLERLCATAITDSRKLKIFSHQIFSVPHGTEIIQPSYDAHHPPLSPTLQPLLSLQFLQEDAAMEMSTAKATYLDGRHQHCPFLHYNEHFQSQQKRHEKRQMGPSLANPDQLFQFAKFKGRQVKKRLWERDADDPMRRVRGSRTVRGYKFFDGRKYKT